MKTKSTLTKALDFIAVECTKPTSIRKAVEIKGPTSTGKTISLKALFKGRMSRINCPQLVEDAAPTLPYPNLEEKTVTDLVIAKFKRVFDEAPECAPAPYCLFLDEFAACNRNVKKVLNDVLDVREIGEYELPYNVMVVLASNSIEDACGVEGSMAHTVRRKRIFHIDNDTEGSTEYAISKGWHSDVLAYLAMTPSAWYCNHDNVTPENMKKMFMESARLNDPFACSSGWEAVSNDLHYYEATLVKNKQRVAENKKPLPTYEPDLQSFASAVGDARANHFVSMRGFKIPEHADLLEGRAEFPDEPMPRWVAVIRCGQLLTVGNSEKTIRIIRELNPEMVEVFLKVGGVTAKNYLKANGKNAPSNGRMALFQFPGFKGTIFAPESRYAKALECE